MTTAINSAPRRTTFDYARAWREAASPAFESLPPNVRTLLARVTDSAAELAQLPDCSMPWPNDGGALREAFEAIDSDTLAYAARVIYNAGHWKPGAVARGGRPDINAAHGDTLKFAHYADQVLRGRLNMPERGTGHSRHRGWGYEVHQGVIRLWYASADLWMWEEIAPATTDGRTRADAIKARIQDDKAARLALNPDGYRPNDRAAADAIEAYRANPQPWPEPWEAIMTTDRFMVEAEDAREVLPEERAAKIAAERAHAIERHDKATRESAETLAAEMWCLDHGLSTDNVIFYNHTGVLTFGWRTPLSTAAVSAVLDVISEYPGKYCLKCADGRTLTN